MNKKTYGNDLWNIIIKETEILKSSDPELEDFLEKNIFSFDNLFDSVTNILTNKLSDKKDSVNSLRESISIALSSEIIQLSIEEDINSVFEKKYTSSLMKSHLDRKKDNRKLLWTLFVLENWHRNQSHIVN